MIYDNGVDSSNQMLVFGTDEGLRHLVSSTTWFLDGTFNVAPSLFTQLYVIRAPLGDSSVTCVYGFLINKNQSTYEEFLSAIQDRHTVTLQAKLHKLSSDRSQDIKTIPEVLRGVGHCV